MDREVPPWLFTEVVVVGFSESYVFRIFFKAANVTFHRANTVMFGFFLSWCSIYGFFAPLFSTASKVWTSSIRLFFITPLLKGKTVMFWWFLFGYFSCFPRPRPHKKVLCLFSKGTPIDTIIFGLAGGTPTLGRRSAEVLEQTWTNYWWWFTRCLDV